jgi:hypothetical protein
MTAPTVDHQADGARPPVHRPNVPRSGRQDDFVVALASDGGSHSGARLGEHQLHSLRWAAVGRARTEASDQDATPGVRRSRQRAIRGARGCSQQYR